MSKFSRWLASARRFFKTSTTIRRTPRSGLRWNGRLESRLAPAVLAPALTGGVTVASGDVDGDGAIDLIVGAGSGGAPSVWVYSGCTGALIRQFDAFENNFTGGVFVAAGDVNGDGKADIIVGAGHRGGPRVTVFDGATGSAKLGDGGKVLLDFYAYDRGFTGGVRVAAGDVNNDGKADIFTGAGFGGGPHVEVFNAANGKLLLSVYAYDPSFTGGVYVGAGDVTGDGRADVITGAGEGGQPIVNVLDPTKGLGVYRSFFAYDPKFQGGVHVAGTSSSKGHPADILTGAGPGGGPHVKVFNGVTLNETKSFMAYDPIFTGGVFVARSDFDQTGLDDIVTGAGAGGGPHVKGFNGNTLTRDVSFYAFEGVNGVGPGPFADHVAPIITITSPSGSPTLRTNLTVTGTVTDNCQGGVIFLQVVFDVNGSARSQVVPLDASGHFTFTTNYGLDGSDDGPHMLRFSAYDKAQNFPNNVTVNFTLDAVVTAPSFNLADASDTGTKGDYITGNTSVTLDGKTDAGAKVELTQLNLMTTADANGVFHFNGVTLASGQNTVTVKATDSLGNTNETTTTVILNSAPIGIAPFTNVDVKQGAADQVIDLFNNFNDVDLVNTTVRYNTSAGPVDVELRDRQAPLTVANFLAYVNSGAYTSSIFHRSVTNFVLQGGGFNFHSNPSRLDAITTNVGSSRVDLQACKLEYSIVSPK